MPAPTRRLAPVVALVAVVLAACETAQPVRGPDAPTGHWRWTPQADRLQLGVTHTCHSLDPHHPDDVRAFRADDGQLRVNLAGAPADPGDGSPVLPAWGIDVPDGHTP